MTKPDFNKIATELSTLEDLIDSAMLDAALEEYLGKRTRSLSTTSDRPSAVDTDQSQGTRWGKLVLSWLLGEAMPSAAYSGAMSSEKVGARREFALAIPSERGDVDWIGDFVYVFLETTRDEIAIAIDRRPGAANLAALPLKAALSDVERHTAFVTLRSDSPLAIIRNSDLQGDPRAWTLELYTAP